MIKLMATYDKIEIDEFGFLKDNGDSGEEKVILCQWKPFPQGMGYIDEIMIIPEIVVVFEKPYNEIYIDQDDSEILDEIYTNQVYQEGVIYPRRYIDIMTEEEFLIYKEEDHIGYGTFVKQIHVSEVSEILAASCDMENGIYIIDGRKA